MPVLELDQLVKRYTSPEGGVETVIDIGHLEIEEGAHVALQGASGSGKTTLLHLIAGILRPDEGRIVLAGHDLTALSEAERDGVRARHLGYVFQTFNLLQGYTALENVLLGMIFGGRADRAGARALLEEVGLGDRMDYRPRQLSVGQQQRVAVARAMANAPDLVLADEPTGNLDPRLAADALGLVRRLCEENGAALLLVSHDAGILGQFDDVRELTELNRARA